MSGSSSQQDLPHMRSVSRFLELYPENRPEFSLPGPDGNLFVFWTQKEQASDDGAVTAKFMVHEKIKSAFQDLQWFSSAALLQFWSLEKVSVVDLDVDVLSTTNQPFALVVADPTRWSIRMKSAEFPYNLNPNSSNLDAPPCNAYYSNMAQAFPDLRLHNEFHLAAFARASGFMSCFVVPVYDLKHICVGVVECYLENFDDLLSISISLVGALEKRGLTFSRGHANLPYQAMGGLKPAMIDIKRSLMKICEAHDLKMAQCSLLYEVPLSLTNALSSSSSTPPKTLLALSLLIPCIDDDEDGEERLVFTDLCDSFDMNPFMVKREVVERARGNYKPHYFSNIFDTPGLENSTATSGVRKLSSLVICLRGTETGDNDLVFEFFWAAMRNPFTVIESIISRLHRFLPNLNFSSGAKLGDQSQVVDVGIYSESEFVIFEKGMLSGEKGRANDVTQKDIEDQFSLTQKEAAKKLRLSINQLKRKCDEYGIDKWTRKKAKTTGQSGSIVPSVSVEGKLAIKAEYGGKLAKMYFPRTSATAEAVKESVADKFNLAVEDLELSYIDQEKDLILITTDDDVKDCLSMQTVTTFAKIIVNKKDTVAGGSIALTLKSS